MDKKLRETTNLCVEIMNSKRQVKGKLGHVVKIRVCRFAINLMFHLSINMFCSWANRGWDYKSDKKTFGCIGLRGLKANASFLRFPFVRNFYLPEIFNSNAPEVRQ